MRWLLVCSIAACYRPGDDATCTLTCATDEQCPSGYTCSASQCAAAGSTCDPVNPDGGPDLDSQPIDGSTACPRSYTSINGTPGLYRYVSLGTSWIQALSDCRNDGGTDGFYTHLVVLSDDAERVALVAASANTSLWVGLSDLAKESVFIPITHELLSDYPPDSGEPWGPGEPDNGGGGGNHDCVAISPIDGSLEDLPCGDPRPFFCECDAFMEDPQTYQPPP